MLTLQKNVASEFIIILKFQKKLLLFLFPIKLISFLNYKYFFNKIYYNVKMKINIWRNMNDI